MSALATPSILAPTAGVAGPGPSHEPGVLGRRVVPFVLGLDRVARSTSSDIRAGQDLPGSLSRASTAKGLLKAGFGRGGGGAVLGAGGRGPGFASRPVVASRPGFASRPSFASRGGFGRSGDGPLPFGGPEGAAGRFGRAVWGRAGAAARGGRVSFGRGLRRSGRALRIVSEIWRLSRSTSSTRTSTRSPGLHRPSRGSFTKWSASCEMCTRPSWWTPMSTNAPKLVTFVTIPGARHARLEVLERSCTSSRYCEGRRTSSRGSRPGFSSSCSDVREGRTPRALP